MFIFKINPEIENFCHEKLKTVNLGNRGIADGNKEEQYVGLVGQVAVHFLLNKKFPIIGGGFDQGVDVIINNLKIDIKTMGRKVEMKNHYVHNFIGLQKNYRNDAYIFCSLNKLNNNLTICGWISKKDFFEKADFYKKGQLRYRDDKSSFPTKADLYEIRNDNLNPINSLNCIQRINFPHN